MSAETEPRYRAAISELLRRATGMKTHCCPRKSAFGLRRAELLLALAILIIAPVSTPARFLDDELELYAAEQKRLIDDSNRPVSERARIALNLAGAFDRACGTAAPSTAASRLRWGQALAVLDDFSRKNPGHAETDPFTLQAAVYRWAQGQTWLRQAELDPADASATKKKILAR